MKHRLVTKYELLFDCLTFRGQSSFKLVATYNIKGPVIVFDKDGPRAGMKEPHQLLSKP